MQPTNKRSALRAATAAFALVVGTLALQTSALAAATITIININAADVGFNETTPAVPVGGNNGTTLGQQRLNAFTYAANLWGATLTSNQPIVINAQFSGLACTATSATLGSAGATSILRNFANAPKADTWYPYALANKLSGAYQGTQGAAQINANFNVNLGKTGCLDGSFFYLGLDGNHGTNVDFVAVLQHEMGHGLGFATNTNGLTGAFSGTNPPGPSIWDWYLMGTSTGLLWKDMTAAQRVASAISVNGLVWSGPMVTAVVPGVLRQGSPTISISGNGAGTAVGDHVAGEASYGPAVTSVPVTAAIGVVATQDAVPGDPNAVGPGCQAFSVGNTATVRNKIAVIDRGVCSFFIKSKNAQLAGALGVIIVNNAAGVAPALGGTDATATIPTVSISQAEGALLKTRATSGTRGTSVVAALGLKGTQYSGADPQGRALLFAPNPYQSGSSVSHFDTTMYRNQLMEPAINGDLTQSMTPPQDMTFILLQEIGW